MSMLEDTLLSPESRDPKPGVGWVKTTRPELRLADKAVRWPYLVNPGELACKEL